MKRIIVFVVLALLIGLAATAAPAQASVNASCSASPSSGPAGTTFTFSCSGFPANTLLWVYVTEPDGIASGAGWNLFFTGSNGAGSYGAKTDKDGNAGGTWVSDGPNTNHDYSDALGAYTWVFQTANGSVIGLTAVQITASTSSLSGATLYQTSATASSASFIGGGFAPNEPVDLWLSIPYNCSSAQNAVEAQAIRPDPFGSGFGKNGIHGPGTVKADADGNIAFSLSFDPNACTGEYAVSARALGSGAGAFTSFTVNGNPVTANADLDVTPDSVNALDPRVTITGAGFPAGANVNCWFTRPDGRVQATNDQNTDSVWTAKVGSDGTFALSAIAGNSTYANDFLGLVSSEEPGVWAATCATPDHSALATYEFTIYGLATDP